MPDRPQVEPLRVDRAGAWWDGPHEVTNPRVLRMLVERLEREDGGRLVVRAGPVEREVLAEDAALVVLDVDLPRDPDAPDARVTLTLTAGLREALDPATLAIGPDDALYALVRGGTIPARFLRAPHYRLGVLIVERSPGEPFVLVLGGRRWPIAARTPRG